MSNPENIPPIDLEAEAQKLRRHFSFTEADLKLNQRGTLSEKQRQRVSKDARGGKIAGILLGVFLLVFAGMMFYFTRLTVIQFPDLAFVPDAWVRFVVGFMWGGTALLLGLLTLGLGVAGMILIVSQLINKTKFTLISIRGRARLEKGHGDRRSHVYYDLYIHEKQFDGDSTMNKAIIPGAEYTVYYLEGVDQIMSIELHLTDANETHHWSNET
ncbi:MAG TPA: hypothetical protein PK530_14535 [Anaerolineales bacterium]|nr:hypothetical protein [Anaerolineales bacterium]